MSPTYGATSSTLASRSLTEPPPRVLNRRRSCNPPSSSLSASKVASKVASSTKASASPSSTATGSSTSSGDSGSVAAGDFTPVKPADWPTATQSGPQPTSTVASASDPYLEELSKAIDNSGNSAFTGVHTGDMTYYSQGLGACGDVYDDSSFTAAVSHLMFDSWPGATAAQNRNPICGPFVPGRMTLNDAGVMVSAVKSSIPGYAEIGGDGLINCVGTGTGSSDVQCHIPLTATVTHGGKSIQVQIVDRCAACQEGDIDLTPAAFTALADMSLGRTDVTWQFDNWS
ncbi:DPBB-1 domain-containing protein [Mycena sanguinolenta]|uniref:DPBB-1 domain-containing protein n=1 Tax=Mycena sanguinolenta TaxID=230812 RepID=A0A8H7DGJ7_9AGAR|nr:DPBB-1 domain-containing protein [Mycena sanguinolenta]